MSHPPDPQPHGPAPGGDGDAPRGGMDIEPDDRATRRGVLGLLANVLAAAAALVVLIPGVSFFLTPLMKRRTAGADFVPLTRFAELEPEKPRSFPVVAARKDAWVTYPPEPIGSVWLVRQPEGRKPPVLAFTAECPHLACAITMAADGREFFCPCHTSGFALDGKRLGGASPRGMDPLEVASFDPQDPDAVVKVRFQRFRTMTEERIPLA